MANHFAPHVSLKFKQLVTHLNANTFTHSSFDKDVLKSDFAFNDISEFQLYKTEMKFLQRIPLYLLKGAYHFTDHFKAIFLNSYLDISGSLREKYFFNIGRYDLPFSTNEFLTNLEGRYFETFNKLFCSSLLCESKIKNGLVNDLDLFIEELLEKATEVLDYTYSLKRNLSYKGAYKDLHYAMGNDVRGFYNYTFKDFEISSTFGTLVDFPNKKVLVCLTLNPEYLEYYLLSSYYQEKMIPDVFSVSIDETFYNKLDKTYTKELLNLVKKGLIEPLDPKIKIDFIDGKEFFNELYSNELTQQLNSLGPIEDIENNALMQEDFLQSKVIEEQLFTKKINLVDI